MATFRALKRELAALLLPPAWPENAGAIPTALEDLWRDTRGMEAVGPLLSFLPRGGLLKWRAVIVLGQRVAALAEADMEDARTVMRRFMWHLNEDSGNMGWGIAETMGETAAQSPPLAREYGRVILSYARDTGFADNFIDHAALRRGAYWAIGRFSSLYPEFREEGAELLLHGLGDEDAHNRGVAAWGVGRLAAAGAFADAAHTDEALRRLSGVTGQGFCEVLDGLCLRIESAASFARRAKELLPGPGAN